MPWFAAAAPIIGAGISAASAPGAPAPVVTPSAAPVQPIPTQATPGIVELARNSGQLASSALGPKAETIDTEVESEGDDKPAVAAIPGADRSLTQEAGNPVVAQKEPSKPINDKSNNEFLGLNNNDWGSIAAAAGILAQLMKQSSQGPQVLSAGGPPVGALPIGALGQVSADIPRLGISGGSSVSQPAVNSYVGGGNQAGILAQLQKLGVV